MVYVSLYIAGKLHTFTSIGRGSALRLILVIIPLLWATMIAVSRTADYHHHWQGNIYLRVATVREKYLEN